MEYGNELDVTSDVANASTPQIVAWCQFVTEAYKYPIFNFFILQFIFYFFIFIYLFLKCSRFEIASFFKIIFISIIFIHFKVRL